MDGPKGYGEFHYYSTRVLCPYIRKCQREILDAQMGKAHLFNIDVPSVSLECWDFLNTRKVWKKEIETQGG